ncbi:NfrA family protein [Bradyrhizobium lablabi]|uniref:NfrA family protein n=1 Tax=Bradyrhizobium lablabi TaxID=722472 RepID=UPI001BABF787|nr:tetratricopeptide repeat protein [Bradyrhizobium lablabi]MBR0697812.1 bacteriophage N4 adsorption protein A [Bradyrhizobium lablabi]
MLLLAAALCPRALAQAPDSGPPLEGDAYVAADTAYRLFAQGDYRGAVDHATQAVTLRPDILRLRLLLIDGLIAAGDLTKAQQVTTTALADFADNDELKSRQASIRQHLAQASAGEGYKALQQGDAKAAIRAARAAIERRPNELSYRLLLLSSQLADDRLSDALATATDASKLAPSNYVPLIWRAYINQRLGNRVQAVHDFDAALALPNLSESETKNISLIAADAALASGDFVAAQKLLAAYPRTDPQVIIRISDADAAAAHTATLAGDGRIMPAPLQDCRTDASGTICSLQAPIVRSVATPIDKIAESHKAGDLAYQAARRKDYEVAIREARKAIENNPEEIANHLLLLNVLAAAGRSAEVETEATRLINSGAATPEVYAQRGYARKQLHQDRKAMSDWELALQKGLPREQARGVRLALADTALTAKEPARALRALDTLPVSYDTAIRRAYALQALGRKQQSLVAFRTAERLAPTNQQRDEALRAAISLMVDLGNKAEARSIFDNAVAHGRLNSVREADLAYLAAAVGNDEMALRLFDRASAKGELPPRAAIDAGYTAMRRFENAKAIAYLKQGIDAKADGKIDIDDQKLFETRRTVANLSREWGINSSIIYGKVGSAPNPFFITGGGVPSNYTSQLGTELYYRPEGFGYRNGAIFELFGRLFETLYDQSGGPTGSQTTQGMVGARWKPLSDQNLVFEVDKLFAGGDAARNDTLLRALYSYTVGTDLRVLESSWTTWYIYSEVDRYLEREQWIGIFEGRFGRSFRLDSISSKLVFFPHVVVAANYDDSFAKFQAYSAGVGGSLRYWFGETKYLAPPSFLEITLQYRFRLAGDGRAEGIFAQTSLNY